MTTRTITCHTAINSYGLLGPRLIDKLFMAVGMYILVLGVSMTKSLSVLSRPFLTTTNMHILVLDASITNVLGKG